ncbi:MAG: type VI secretion system tip protein VgrG, partial [Bacteroidota bacterium]
MSSHGNMVSDNPGLATYILIIDGTVVPGKYGIGRMSVSREFNRIPTATIIIPDGDAARQMFDGSNEDFFIPGKEIEIKIGYKTREQSIFKGIIVSHSVKIEQNFTSLVIVCKDKAFKMTLGRKSRIFYESRDSDAIETLIADAGLVADVEATSQTHHELVQYASSDWDFMVSRAQVCGRLCLAGDGTITVKKPDFSQSPVMNAEFGRNIFTFDAEIDARNQFSSYKATTWDFSGQAIADTDAANPAINRAGNLSESDLATASGSITCELKHTGYLKPEILQEWVDAKSSLQQLSKIRGRVQLQGDSILKPGQLLNLKGISDRFNGAVLISGVLHTLSEGNWLSDVQFGIKPEWFAELYNINPLPASGMIPAVHGLQIGVVTALEGDPDNEYRIRVKIPIVNNEEEGIWAR